LPWRQLLGTDRSASSASVGQIATGLADQVAGDLD
jgi:hypothetical protein